MSNQVTAFGSLASILLSSFTQQAAFSAAAATPTDSQKQLIPSNSELGNTTGAAMSVRVYGQVTGLEEGKTMTLQVYKNNEFVTQKNYTEENEYISDLVFNVEAGDIFYVKQNNDNASDATVLKSFRCNLSYGSVG